MTKPPTEREMQLKYPLRDWQKAALAKWRERGCRGIIEVVTGGGKTIFAEACILDVLAAVPDLAVLIIVPSVALLDQWVVSLQEEAGIPEERIAIWSAGARPELAPINVMVINTARRLAPDLLRGRPAMLVVDECHRAGSSQNIRALQGQYMATLGLSATPERQYDQALDEALIPTLGPIIYRYGLVQGRQDGVISQFELINVKVDFLADEEKEYIRLSRRIGVKMKGMSSEGSVPEDVQTLLRARARVSARATMRIPVGVKLVERHRGQRTMIFHEDIKAASAIVDNLRARGHSATIYHTGIGEALRRDNLRLYRRGVFDVLACCRALDEGVNVPETQVAVIAAATATTRQRIQRLGRVLRPAKGKERAIIYTVYVTAVEEERLMKEAQEYEGTATVSWQRVQVPRG